MHSRLSLICILEGETATPSALIRPCYGYGVNRAYTYTVVTSGAHESRAGPEPVVARLPRVRFPSPLDLGGPHRKDNLRADQDTLLAQERNGAFLVVYRYLRCSAHRRDLHYQTPFKPGRPALSIMVIARRGQPVSQRPHPKQRIGSMLLLSILTSYLQAPN